jgi:DNA-binding transcriptional ArsR family regulator
MVMDPAIRRGGMKDGKGIPTFFSGEGVVPHLARRTKIGIYALTRIYAIWHIMNMGSVFDVIAEPHRRAILALLVVSPMAVGDIETHLGVPQTTVSKHLRILRQAGVVECSVAAQRRIYQIRAEPLQEIDSWLAQFRKYWSPHLDALERHLDPVGQR